MGAFKAYYARKDKETLGYFDKTFIMFFIIGTPIFFVNIYSAVSHHNISLLRLTTILISCIIAAIVGCYYERQNRDHDKRD